MVRYIKDTEDFKETLNNQPPEKLLDLYNDQIFIPQRKKIYYKIIEYPFYCKNCYKRFKLEKIKNEHENECNGCNMRIKNDEETDFTHPPLVYDRFIQCTCSRCAYGKYWWWYNTLTSISSNTSSYGTFLYPKSTII